MASDATTKVTTDAAGVTTPKAKKPAAKKTAAKKASPKKPGAKKATATKSTAKQAKAAKAAPTKAPLTSAPSSVVAAIPGFVASVPGLVASAIEDLGRLDLRTIELPAGVEVAQLPEAVVDFAEAAAKRGSDLAAAAAKRGAETVSSVQHGVVLFREAVGL